MKNFLAKNKFFISIYILTLILGILITTSGFLLVDVCDDPKAPHCSKEGDKNHKPCGKCEMDCNEEGRKPEDRRCTTFCCDDKCDCSPPCS